MSEEVPIVVGSAGLTGRQQIARPAEDLEEPEGYDDDGKPIWSKPRAQGRGIPATCLRVLSGPRSDGCSVGCPGVQRDGGCLCDVVRAAVAAGVTWKFEVDRVDGFWDYEGDPIPGFVTERRDFGQIHTRWLPGHEPSEPFEVKPEPTHFDFRCPHCGRCEVHVLGLYWCSECGLNANDPKEEE